MQCYAARSYLESNEFSIIVIFYFDPVYIEIFSIVIHIAKGTDIAFFQLEFNHAVDQEKFTGEFFPHQKKIQNSEQKH